MSIVKDEHDASDVLQESFVKIWSKINTYDQNVGNFFTWILKITRNTAIDKYRSNKKNNFRITENLKDRTDTVDMISVDSIGLKEIVDKLNPEQVAVINELFYKGATHQEAAKELNLPLGTVKSRVRAALKKLRVYYKLAILILLLWK